MNCFFMSCGQYFTYKMLVIIVTFVKKTFLNFSKYAYQSVAKNVAKKHQIQLQTITQKFVKNVIKTILIIIDCKIKQLLDYNSKAQTKKQNHPSKKKVQKRRSKKKEKKSNKTKGEKNVINLKI